MSGSRSNIVGMEAPPRSSPADDPLAPGPGTAGPTGANGNAVPMTSRTIAVVTRDWTPTPSPTKKPDMVVSGKTLAAVGRALDALGEWGQAGGSLRTDAIPPGNDTNLTVRLHGNLVYRLPRWTDYASASKAVKDEWDRMFQKLTAHEDRHLAIAIEEGDLLAKDLVGKDMSDIVDLVTAANERMRQRQDDLDTDTDHGAKPGVLYGDVFVDTSIT